MKDSQIKSKSESSLSQDLESKPAQAIIKNLKDIIFNILKNTKVWLTIDEKEWVYVELRKGGSLWVNYGLDEQETTFDIGVKNVHDFLTFKRSTDLL